MTAKINDSSKYFGNTDPPNLAGVLLEKFFGFVDLSRKIGASAPIRVVQQHERPVSFSNFVFRDGALTVSFISRSVLSTAGSPQRMTSNGNLSKLYTYLRANINEASFFVIRCSNPPL